MMAYQFKLTCRGKEAWCEVDPKLVEKAVASEFEAFALCISPAGMDDPDMKVESVGLINVVV